MTSVGLDQHPTVLSLRRSVPRDPGAATVSADDLRRWCLAAGADDVGFVGLDRAELAGQRAEILRLFPRAKTLISFVRRMSRENIRTPARSVANLEFHHVHENTDEIACKIVALLEKRGIGAVNGGAMGFPMEMDRWPDKAWVISHKPVAVAAGLGRMGIHRNVIHPRFGNFILLGTVVTEAGLDYDSAPIDYNPCLECKLCVAACPTGAIAADGHFDSSACYTHNYREFMSGFGDWVEQIAASPDAISYRKKVSAAETVSMWQSLAFGPNYKAAYCLSVCPAGEDVISPFLHDRPGFLNQVVRPLQEKQETIYAVPGSDAAEYAQKRFPHKKVKLVSNGLRPATIAGFLRGLPHVFQRGQSKGLDATYHFTFTGRESARATVVIRHQQLRVLEGHQGTAGLRVTADSATWLKFVANEVGILRALLTLKVRLAGSPRLLLAFGKCFPV